MTHAPGTCRFALGAGVLLALLAGCRPATGPASGTANAPAAGASWRWEDYPEAGEMLVAQLPATVRPLRIELARAPAAGTLRVAPGILARGTVTAGEIWARIEADDATDAKAATARLRRTVDERRERYAHFEQPLALARLDKEIADTAETLALAKFAEQSPELFRGDTPGLDPRLRPTLSAAQLTEQLALLRERRARTVVGERDTEPPDLQLLRTQLEERERTEAARTEQLALKARFPGRLRVARDWSAPAEVAAGELVAAIEDASAVEIRVPAQLPLLHAVAADTLRAEVTLPGAATATAGYAGTGIEVQGDTVVPLLRFRLESAGKAPPPGVQVPVLIYTRLPRPARIVPKLELARQDAAGVLAAGWRAGISRLFPGRTLVAEGRNVVAIAPDR